LPSPKVRSASLLCILGILITLALLYFLPETFRQKKYSHALSQAEAKAFPLDIPVQRVSKGDREQSTIRNLVKHFPQGAIVNFWGTWCPPCLEELPSLETLGRQLSKLGPEKYPQLLTISVDEQVADITKLLADLPYQTTFPIFHDPLGRLAREAGTTKFPETYWLDSEGKLVHKWVGPQNWNGAEVLEMLASRKPSR